MLDISLIHNFYTVVFFIFGSLLGSFSNVVILRMSSGASVIFPPSACPKCNHRLSFLDLVPVFSWLFLRGSCRYCKASIAYQYPLVEAAISMIVGFSFYKHGISLSFIAISSFLTIWFITSVIFLRNEVQKHRPFIWALCYFISLSWVAHGSEFILNNLFFVFLFALATGIIASVGKKHTEFTKWAILSFIAILAIQKNVSAFYSGSIFIILAVISKVNFLAKPSRIMFFLVQLFFIVLFILL